MELNEILTIVTFVVTLFFGVITKKSSKIKNNIIPLQNIAIGLIIAIIEWVITKDFNTAILLSGLTAGGTYDLVKNLNEMKEGK